MRAKALEAVQPLTDRVRERGLERWRGRAAEERQLKAKTRNIGFCSRKK